MDVQTRKKRPSDAGSKPAPRKVVAKRSPMSKARFKKALVRYTIVATNLIIVGFAVFMVIANSDGNAATYGSIADDEALVNPLDRVSSADIAVNVARMANLAEAVSVTNYADTVNTQMETFSIGSTLAFAPQLMTADTKTLADIKEYITVPGDTVAGLASKFNVTSDSIRWSNDLLGDAIQPGIRLLIPPMNGIIYTVRSGDTVERLASLYRVPVSKIIAFNDAEVSGLVNGKTIFIPGGQKPAPVFSFYARYGNNGYDFGQCTYYASAKSGAPGGWGDARTWAINANRTPGWLVDKVPVKGAIAQTTGQSPWGHVAIVEDVKQENGLYFIKYSDMNGIAGYNRVGYSGWVSASTYQSYIYRVR